MNWQPLKVEAYASVDDYIAKSARLHRSLRRPEPRRKLVAEPKRAVRIEYIHAFDEHVTCWRRHLAQQNMTVREYIKVRCEEIGVSYQDVIGDSRFRDHTVPRQMLMWEVKKKRPQMPLTMIGKEFGGRDHSTIVHAIQQHERRLAGDGSAKG